MRLSFLVRGYVFLHKAPRRGRQPTDTNLAIHPSIIAAMLSCSIKAQVVKILKRWIIAVKARVRSGDMQDCVVELTSLDCP